MREKRLVYRVWNGSGVHLERSVDSKFTQYCDSYDKRHATGVNTKRICLCISVAHEKYATGNTQ